MYLIKFDITYLGLVRFIAEGFCCCCCLLLSFFIHVIVITC